MTPTELAQVVDYCEERWPGTRNYRQWDKAAWDFTSIPAAAVREAAQLHFNAGERTAPTLSQLRAEGARLASQKGMTDPRDTNCDTRGAHSRNWAVSDADKEGYREAMCLDCGTTIIRPANQMLTVGEAAIVAAEGRGDGYTDDLTDRIAP